MCILSFDAGKNRPGYICYPCQWQGKKNERLEFKRQLVAEFGGECAVCGFNKCDKALCFHHLDPKEKDITLSEALRAGWSIDKMREEAEKCKLLCLNCHAMVHAGDLDLEVEWHEC